MLTNIEIIDKVTEHLLKQGKRAMFYDEDMGRDRCAYRGENGTKCAVGCLIPDDKYKEDIEGIPVYEIFHYGVLDGIVDRFQTPLLARLQAIHDGVNPIYWDRDLNNIKQEYQ